VVLLGEPDAVDLPIAPRLDIGTTTLADGRRVQLWAHYGPNLEASRTLPTRHRYPSDVTPDHHRGDPRPREAPAPDTRPVLPPVLVACGPDRT
jgi:hypothetical protein